MIRLTVSAAEDVWSVERTKCPVSAAVIAVEIVSRSRISPTRMISGSSRRAALSALANESVSSWISLWLIIASPCIWRYSIGSSRVRMWHFLLMFTCPIMAARVVDLPEPVGPVTRISPLGFITRSLKMFGSPNCSHVGISFVMVLAASA